MSALELSPLVAAPAREAASPPCPLCSGTRSRVLRTIAVTHPMVGGTYRLRRCSDCDLVHLTPRLEDATLATLYGEDF